MKSDVEARGGGARLGKVCLGGGITDTETLLQLVAHVHISYDSRIQGNIKCKVTEIISILFLFLMVFLII